MKEGTPSKANMKAILLLPLSFVLYMLGCRFPGSLDRAFGLQDASQAALGDLQVWLLIGTFLLAALVVLAKDIRSCLFRLCLYSLFQGACFGLWNYIVARPDYDDSAGAMFVVLIISLPFFVLAFGAVIRLCVRSILMWWANKSRK